jgi:hypothetical protein
MCAVPIVIIIIIIIIIIKTKFFWTLSKNLI